MSYWKRLQNRKGQTAVEFTIVCLVVFFFLLFFLSLSFVLILSQYMDYATFMAARTYKAAHGRVDVQQQRAREVFKEYADLVTGNALVKEVSNLEFPKFVQIDANGRERLVEGVRARYTVNLFYMPPIFITGSSPQSGIQLTSETFLGRDPTYEECTDFFSRFTRSLGIQMQINGRDLTTKMEDNGC